MAQMLQNLIPRAGGPAGSLAGPSVMEPNISLIPRAVAPALMPQADGPAALTNAGALAGPAGALDGPAEDPATMMGTGGTVSTAADAGDNRWSLQDVTHALVKHAKDTVRKRPAAGKQKQVRKKPAAGKPAADKAASRENGCPKCRGKPGCTPSCIKLNTRPF
jgi:hypothetical protein